MCTIEIQNLLDKQILQELCIARKYFFALNSIETNIFYSIFSDIKIFKRQNTEIR